ncbi:SGNH/GDSL hydrolase family protein [Streptomyces sp. cg2]|uniref:SGNH/GDSL hydrolase family protein n=1 Tax=Streptomyces sp. cg2 TaxID=3238799 RepID=UPI0034E2E6C2
MSTNEFDQNTDESDRRIGELGESVTCFCREYAGKAIRGARAVGALRIILLRVRRYVFRVIACKPSSFWGVRMSALPKGLVHRAWVPSLLSERATMGLRLNNVGMGTRCWFVLLVGSAVSSALIASPVQAAGGSGRGVDAGKALAVSLGDSFIAGEGARWFGNSLEENGGRLVTNRENKLAIPDWMEKNPDLFSGKSRDDIFPDGTFSSKEPGKINTPGCHRSDAAEIHVADIGHAGRTRNLACSGATTDAILTRDFKGEKPQIQQLDSLLKSADVDTVVVSIGGNDLRLAGLVKACVKKYFNPLSGGECTSKSHLTKADAGEYSNVAAKVEKVLARVKETFKNKEKPQPRIILQGYPRPIAKKEDIRPPEGVSLYPRYAKLGYPFGDDAVDLLQQVNQNLNAVLGKAAASASVDYLDPTEAFQGHELGHKDAVLQVERGVEDGRSKGLYGAERLEWMRWVDNVADNAQRKQESLHPNYLGTQSEAACLSSFIKQMTKPDTRYVGRCQIANATGTKRARPDQTTAAVTEAP